MGFIRIPVTLIGRKGEKDVMALFDTGCTHSLVEDTIARKIGFPEDLPEPENYEAAVGTCKATKGIFATMSMEGKLYPAEFRVVPGLTEEVIVGHQFMQLWRVKIDMNMHVLTLDPKALKMLPLRVGPRRRK